MSTQLSVNLNKIALMRNSRGNNIPNIIEAAKLAIAAGCHGITLHPRIDKRHATLEDVIELLTKVDEIKTGKVELNIEGDLRPDLIEIVKEYPVHQFTIVPVTAGELTTTRGWNKQDDEKSLTNVIKYLKNKTRISLFIEPDENIVEYVANLGINAVEFYTYRYAISYATIPNHELDRISRAADRARRVGLRVHLGHDLNLENLDKIIEKIQPDEVSIGHALISDALMVALGPTIKKYLSAIHNKIDIR